MTDPTGQTEEEIATDETGSASDDRPTEEIIFNFSEVKAHLLDAMSWVFAQYNESDWDFISR